jgi:hypothetical protein
MAKVFLDLYHTGEDGTGKLDGKPIHRGSLERMWPH